MTGDTDLGRRTKQPARIADVPIILAKMHPIRADALRQRGAVVDDERDLPLGADRLKRFGEPRRLMLVDPFYPDLERRDRPPVEC